jgi:hypothetical protein
MFDMANFVIVPKFQSRLILLIISSPKMHCTPEIKTDMHLYTIFRFILQTGTLKTVQSVAWHHIHKITMIRVCCYRWVMREIWPPVSQKIQHFFNWFQSTTPLEDVGNFNYKVHTKILAFFSWTFLLLKWGNHNFLWISTVSPSLD